MSGLGEVWVWGPTTPAWLLLVVLLGGLVACNAGRAPGPATPDGTGSGAGPETRSAPPPPAMAGSSATARAAAAGSAAAAQPRLPASPRDAGITRPARRPGASAAEPGRHAVKALAGDLHGGNLRTLAAIPPVLPTPVPVLKPPVAAVRAARPDTAADLASYVARVSASDRIELPGAKGLLTVWIGLASSLPQENRDTVSATQSLGMRGQTAKVTPFAPDFEVDPASTVCEQVVPSGSVVNFALVPKRAGDLTVGANVALFESSDCSGVPIPKSTGLISVQVRVCRMCYVESGLSSMGRTAWTAFSQFWTWLLGVIFLTLGVLINRWRRRRFHITKADEESRPGSGT